VDDEGRLPTERALRRRLDAFDPGERVELLRVLELTDEDRAIQIASFFADPRLQTMGELLIDLEADPAARGIVITELRIMNRRDG
jgi:hypothetical protein